MELKEGMYVRTKEGNIEKICAIENVHIYTDEDYLSWYPNYNAISKASHNIIDLIEVGDYVNGYEVTSKDQFLGFGNHDWYIADYEIKSIVTKEQFESMEYKVN